jgi:uncharacterized protein
VRVFLDTNVLVSAFATRGLAADVFRVVLAEHELVIGEVVLTELRRVLRERFRVPTEVIDEIEALLRTYEVIPPPPVPSTVEVRDETDRWVLASAESAAADVLVTGDRDLLAIASATSVRILNPRNFWESLRGRR